MRRPLRVNLPDGRPILNPRAARALLAMLRGGPSAQESGAGFSYPIRMSEPDQINDGRDLGIEAWLRQHGATNFHLRRNIAIDVIDENRSRRNNAREFGTVAGAPERYAQASKDGAVFRPLIGYDTRQGIVLIDGNNRHEGFKLAGVQRVDVYIVDAEPELLQILTETANELNGERNSKEVRLEHAANRVAQGWTLTQAAKAQDLSTIVVGEHVRWRESCERARRLYVSQPTRLPKIAHLFTTIQFDLVFIALCEAMAQRADPLDKPVRGLVKEVRAARSEDAQLEIISRWLEATRAPVRAGSRGPSALFRPALAQIRKLSNRPEQVTVSLDARQRAALAADCRLAKDALDAMLAALEA